MTLKKRPSLLIQRIISLIREELGVLPQETPLPPETELATRFGVSRKSIRAAMSILEEENLIYRVRGKGTFPAAPGRAPMAFTPRAARIGAAGLLSLGGEGFYSSLMHGAYNTITDAGGELVLAGRSKQAMMNLCGGARVDGVMLVSVTDQNLINELAGTGMPLCLVDHFTEEAQIDCVRVDSFGGSRVAVEHLYALGHRRIAYLHPERAEVNPLRLEGYLTAREEKKLDPNEELLKYINGTGVTAAVTQLLGLPEPKRPTALITFSDHMAIEAMQAAVRFGLELPRDLSIVGAGGPDPIPSAGLPELTSVHFNTAEMGGTAIRCLMERIDDFKCPVRDIIVPAHLHLGQSTGKPR
jgi:DNA-binding LacI/PurR family transcriptional regulator